MECILERRDPDFQTGLDGADATGLSALSGRLLSKANMEPDNSSIIALAGKLARHAGTQKAPGEAPLAGHDEILVQVSFSTAILARAFSWFPAILIRLLLRIGGLRQKLAILDALLPPAPVVLAGGLTVRVQEQITLSLPSDRTTAPDLTGSGQVNIRMEVQRRNTRDALRRHFKRIPSSGTASAGYLLFWGRLGLEWDLSSVCSAIGRPIGRHVIALEDLSCHPGFLELKNDPTPDRNNNAVIMPVETALDYGMPTLLAERSIISRLFVIAANIPGENEVRRLDFTITLRPDADGINLFKKLYPATLGIFFPNSFPPIATAVAQIRAHTKQEAIETTSVKVLDQGSGVSIITAGRNWISPGNSIVVSLTFREEIQQLVAGDGRATLRLAFNYDHPMSGITNCTLLPRSGRFTKGVAIKVICDSLRLHVASEVLLDQLKFPAVKREAWEQPAETAARLDAAFVRRVVDRLADHHILVRQALQGQSSGYDGGESDVRWDLYARYEESMAGPDVHIGIRPGNAGSMPAKFEVIVLGQAASPKEQDHIHKVRTAVVTALQCGIGLVPSELVFRI